MVERTDELREDIEARRRRITRTVDQIENRLSPGRVIARSRFRVKARLVDMKDRVMGNDQSGYPWQGQHTEGMSDRMSDMTDRASDRLSETGDMVSQRMHQAEETISEVPQRVRRQTAGNPIAAGLVAFGGGMLIGSVISPTRAEQKMADRIEPALDDAMEEARERGGEIAEDMRQSARSAAEDVKDEARDAGGRLRHEAEEAASSTQESRH